MNELKFYCKYLLLEGNTFNLDYFSKGLSIEELIFYENETYYNVHIQIINHFVKVYLEYGNILPRPEHVINTETAKAEDNPRTEVQIEPKQMFIVIDTDRSFAWFSNIKKSSILSTILYRLGFKSEIKNIYNAEDFIDKLKSVNGIKLSSTPDKLFNLTKLKDYLDSDIYGYGASTATLELKYKKTINLTGDIQENIKELFSSRISFDKFIISGKDDGNMDVVFNNESLVEKIFLDIPQLPSGEFDKEEVFSNLIQRLNS